MGFVEIAKLIVSLLPTIISAIRFVEQALPQAGLGSAKLGFVLNTIGTAGTLAGKTIEEIEALKPAITSVVNHTVEVFNTFKLWDQPQGD